MAVHTIQGKGIRVVVVDHIGNEMDLGTTIPGFSIGSMSSPMIFDETWTESLLPLSARDEIMMMHQEINYKIGIEKKANPEDRPASNRKEKRRRASIDRKMKLK